MNEELLKRYHSICVEHADWWGWEDGYTHEEGYDFLDHITESLFKILDQIEKEVAE